MYNSNAHSRFLSLPAHLCVLLSCLSAAGAEKPLQFGAASNLGRTSRVTAKLEVQGHLLVKQEAKLEKLALGVVGQLGYVERILAVDGKTRRSVRHYEQSKAEIHIDRATINPELREECRLVGAEFDGSAVSLFCPRTSLSRDELDLIDFPGASLLLDALLPTNPVSPGDTWSHDDGLWAGMLRLDAVAANDVKSRLAETVAGKSAKMVFAGHVDGAVDGVTTEIEVSGSYLVDLTTNCITVLDIQIKEKRSVSPIGPGLDVVAHLHLEIAPIAAAPALSEEELKDLPLELKTAGDRLSYQSSAKNYRFLHPRSWHVMDERPELTVFRMVERGELVAQCNIATPPVAKSNEPPSLEQFQKEVEKALGSNLGQIVQVAASTSPRGCVVLRVVATGQVSELPIEWHYYLVANRNGRQVVLAFTMEQSLVERLADTDQEIVGNLEILEPAPKSAAVPTTTK